MVLLLPAMGGLAAILAPSVLSIVWSHAHVLQVTTIDTRVIITVHPPPMTLVA
jgi:hypothetical protein